MSFYSAMVVDTEEVAVKAETKSKVPPKVEEEEYEQYVTDMSYIAFFF